LVAAATPHGPALFIVESSSKGIQISAEPAMGLRAAATARVRFDNVRLPASALLGSGEKDFSYANFVARSRLAWCALAVGTAQAALDGSDDVYPVFGGDRRATEHPVHACPASRFAMGTM
ncbi:UNVERIFIED_CONTAM: acyl-CoA dehydrogenase, partial [Salmonella enterica subsp. enterica serovar Weltevreden]